MRTACKFLLVLGVGLVGCGTYTTYQTAEPLPRGRWQVSLAGSPGVFYDSPSKIPTPTVISEVAARRGVGGDTDVGLKFFSIGTELSVRTRIANGTWQWALLGAFAFARSEESGGQTAALFGQLRAGAAATRRTSSSFAFTAGPLFTGSAYSFAGGGSARGLLAGAFANVQWTVGDARRWHLLPELSLHGTLAGDVPVDGFVTLLGLAVARDL